MRIRGSGSGFFGFGSGGDSRSDSFKQGRRPGQKVQGKLLKWVSEDMAWVEIEGHKLLAQLQSKPPVGALLTFLIKQLQPDIVLKEIFGVSTAGSNAVSMANDFDTARTLFENALRDSVDDLCKQPHTERLKAFLALLSNDKKLLSTFLDAAVCIQTINFTIDSNAIGNILYQPWLIPSGRRHITLIRPQKSHPDTEPITETTMEFELGQMGMVRAEFIHKRSTTGYRLKLQHIAKGEDVKRYLVSRKHLDLAGEVQCLGISKLPQASHGGILAELMFAQKK
ncbi:MAG: hypothetical protein OCC46_06450 [Pseudodesulfovibrio sp.]